MKDFSETSVLKQISARLKTSSAVVPALLCALIAMPLGFSGLMFGKAAYASIFSIILLSPMFLIIIQIAIFTFVDRDRLHNEEHLERRMMIDQGRSIIGDNQNQKQITLDNTSTKRLLEGGSDEEIPS